MVSKTCVGSEGIWDELYIVDFFFCLKGKASLISYSLSVQYCACLLYSNVLFFYHHRWIVLTWKIVCMRQERKLRHKKVLLTGGPRNIVYCVHPLLKRAAFLKDSRPVFILLVVWLVLQIPYVIWRNLWPSNFLTFISYLYQEGPWKILYPSPNIAPIPTEKKKVLWW